MTILTTPYLHTTSRHPQLPTHVRDIHNSNSNSNDDLRNNSAASHPPIDRTTLEYTPVHLGLASITHPWTSPYEPTSAFEELHLDLEAWKHDLPPPPAVLMQSEQSNSSWLAHGQLTPTSTSRRHHREASLSSLGSAGPASPYTANTSNPQVAGDAYHEFHSEYSQPSSKPLTPAHTPLQEQFLAPHYSQYYHHNSTLGFAMAHDGLPKQAAGSELMPAPDFGQSGRRSTTTVASRDSPTTPPSYEDERQKNVYRNTMPKLARTMTDIYADELYNPNFQITSAPPAPIPSPSFAVSPQNDIFTQRLQAANNQHLSASKINLPLAIPSRERSPFRQGSPLAPAGTSFEQHQASSVRFGTATHMREQQKAEDDARAMQRQLERTSPEQAAPKTISPKDVDLVYHENEADASLPLFPPEQSRQTPSYRPAPSIPHEPSETDDNASQRSFASMVTSRRESSSAYSASSQSAHQQNAFSFAPPAVPGGVRHPPQQYPFTTRLRQQPVSILDSHDGFPASLRHMESSNSDYSAEIPSAGRPASATADTGTYTCTYHGCTLRFDTPAKLQRHKREGHRNSASFIGGGDERGMTSSASQRNSQAGPHKCERINPSTGKPCNTIFSRPYDLTRHEDTIHNARKQKVRCHLCTEEKTFSRNDALTRHFRVVHPDHVDFSKGKRRGAHD